jgi:hypothetical protein
MEMENRTDFCEPDCTCQKNFGEVRCCKLLPGIKEWYGAGKLDEQNVGALVDALNKLWAFGGGAL